MIVLDPTHALTCTNPDLVCFFSVISHSLSHATENLLHTRALKSNYFSLRFTHALSLTFNTSARRL